MLNSVNQSIKYDIEQLKKMTANYDMFTAMLENSTLEPYQFQAIEAARCMLKEMMNIKTRDIKRRLGKSEKYE